MKFSYITNNCLAQVLYFSESREYDSPFIGSIFLNDHQFIKLCHNYNYYCIRIKRVYRIVSVVNFSLNSSIKVDVLKK